MTTHRPPHRPGPRRFLRVVSTGVLGVGVLGAASVFGSVALGAPAGAQSSEVPVTVGQVGWWSSRFAAGAQPENGFEVAVGGDGTVQSIAAVELTVAATDVETMPVTLVENGAFAEFASITACTTTAGWAPANPGPVEDAPTPDCGVKVPLTRSADAMVWLGDLAPLFPVGGTVSVMFVPGYGSPAGTGPGAVIPISEVQVEATGSTTTTTAPPTTPTTVDSSVTPTTGGFVGGFDPSDSGPTTTIASGSATPDPDSSSATTTPGLGGDDEAEEEFFSLGEVEDAAADSKPWERLLLLVPLSALIGFGSVRLVRELSERDLLPGAR